MRNIINYSQEFEQLDISTNQFISTVLELKEIVTSKNYDSMDDITGVFIGYSHLTNLFVKILNTKNRKRIPLRQILDTILEFYNNTASNDNSDGENDFLLN